MKSFLLKKGGETENVETYIVTFTRPIDQDLLKTAINKIAGENVKNYDEVISYLDYQFNGIQQVEKLSDLSSFYY